MDNTELPIIQPAAAGAADAGSPVQGNGHRAPIEGTERNDTWWLQPLATFVVFTAFIIYTTWRVFENTLYQTDALANGYDYLSPFFSPTLFKHVYIAGWNVTPAIWVLWIPLFFRGTCYYYRKAYYRAYFWDPPACAVGEVAPRKHYTGERRFPFILMNLHRYSFYFAVLILGILWYDTYRAFRFSDITGHRHFGLAVGSLVFLINVVLLTLYTFSCHSWRHLIGGCVDCFSCNSMTHARHTAWERVTHLNEYHGLWAWLSLISVALTDLYVRSVMLGVIPDKQFFG